MSQISTGPEGEDHSFPLSGMPMTAVQAIYHHVTGKTENMKQNFDGNVLINSIDIDRLHQMILDQIATHHVDFGPTVTVEVKNSNNRAFHHSSWEHYKSIIPSSNEITSEITVKFELVLNLQGSGGPQRCVINVLSDSALPLLSDNDGKPRGMPRSFWNFASQNWRTTTVSIDFVDFMVARGFVGIVEEWFKSLEKTPTPKMTMAMLDKYDFFASISAQMGRIGFAIFLLVYIALNKSDVDLASIGLATCVGLIVWSLYLMIRPPILDALYKRITSNVVSTIIILSDADRKCYNSIIRRMKSTNKTLLGMLATIILSAGVNVSCSYFYSYLTGN